MGGTMRERIQLNADLGEGCAEDAPLMAWIQWANIACGGHAGDDDSMRHAIRQALAQGVLVGAHPSYPDRARFGRVETGASAGQIKRYCKVQLTRFASIAAECGVSVAHVKPHGALYHRVMTDPLAARALIDGVIEAVGPCDVMGLPGSCLQQEAQAAGLGFLSEMFADRRYEADGSLTPRTHPDALILDIEEALAQVASVRTQGVLNARTGEILVMPADTVCVHGDGPQALAMAAALHQLLSA